MRLGEGDGWSVHPIESLPADGRTCMVSATITLDGAKSAGVAFRHATGSDYCYVALLDPVNGEFGLVTLPTFRPLQRLRWEIKPEKSYKVRVVAVDAFIEVYVDDILALNCYDTTVNKGGVALFVEEGSARFSDIEYRSAKASE